jgi:hypothetical protein
MKLILLYIKIVNRTISAAQGKGRRQRGECRTRLKRVRLTAVKNSSEYPVAIVAAPRASSRRETRLRGRQKSKGAFPPSNPAFRLYCLIVQSNNSLPKKMAP